MDDMLQLHGLLGGGLKFGFPKMTKIASENISAGDLIYPDLGNKVRKTRQIDTLMVESFSDSASSVVLPGESIPELSTFISDDIVVSKGYNLIKVDRITDTGIVNGPTISLSLNSVVGLFPLGLNNFMAILPINLYQISIRQYSINPATLAATLVDENLINVQSSDGYSLNLYRACKYAKDSTGKHRVMLLPSWRPYNNTTLYHGLIQLSWDDSVTAIDNVAVSSMLSLGSADNAVAYSDNGVAYDKGTDKVIVFIPSSSSMLSGTLYAITWNKVNGSAQAQTNLVLNQNITNWQVEQFDTATVLKLSPGNTDVYKVNATSPPSLTLVTSSINYNNNLYKTSNESFIVDYTPTPSQNWYTVLSGAVSKKNTSPVYVMNLSSRQIFMAGLDNKAMSVVYQGYPLNGEGQYDIWLPARDSQGRVQHTNRLFLSGLIDVTKQHSGVQSNPYPTFFYNHRTDTYYLAMTIYIGGTAYKRIYKLVKAKEQALGIATKNATTGQAAEFYLLGGQ